MLNSNYEEEIFNPDHDSDSPTLDSTFNCMLLSCHVRVLRWIYTLYSAECKGTPYSKQTRYLKFNWQQQGIEPTTT